VTAALDLLQQVKEAGSDLRVDDGKVKLVRPSNLPPELIAGLKANRAALLAILTSPSAPLATPELADAPAPPAPAGSADAVQGPPPSRSGAAAVEAGGVLLPRPTAAQGRRWVEAADRIVGELGRYQRGDFSRRKWQQTLAGVRRFVEGGWAHRACRLGWGLLELFGVDRKAPWARRDRRGLALMLGGNKVIALTEHDATIETPTGARLTYTRRRIEFLDVVLADQIAPAYRLATIRREWAEVLECVDRCPSLDADVSETRWRQYRADLSRLADENWDYPPSFFVGWNGRGAFPVSAKRALAWVLDGGTITNLTRDTAICGNVVFRRLAGDQGWQRDVGPYLDQGREKVTKWLLD
jgi:hypothetical protein